MSIIETKNLTKSFSFFRKEEGLRGSLKNLFFRKMQEKTAVDSVSFSIEEGELVGFLGPNGAGKTTTLKMLSGLLHPNDGEVRVNGHTPSDRKDGFLKNIAMVMGQKSQLINDLPASDSFRMQKEIFGISDADYKETMEELYDIFEVREYLDIPIRKLSLGQRMKCELIAALLHSPKVLLLDEPTIGLDVVAQKNIREFIKKYNKLKKTTIILTSHYMEDIEELCERVIIINLGKVIYDGKLADLMKQYADYKVLKVSFLKPITKEQLVPFGTITNFESFGATIQIPRDQAKKIAGAILNSDLPVDDILIDEADVDEIIRKIFTK